MAGKPWAEFIKKLRKIYFCLERPARYMACLVYWYVSGTFGRSAFVSFGDSTLNSCSWGHVMRWLTNAWDAKSNIQWEPSWILNSILVWMMSLCVFEIISFKDQVFGLNRPCFTAVIGFYVLKLWTLPHLPSMTFLKKQVSKNKPIKSYLNLSRVSWFHVI